MILLLDNYDSFTYNLAQYLGELRCIVENHRNDKISVEEIARRKPERIVISPGPCTPQDAGNCRFLVCASDTKPSARPSEAKSFARPRFFMARPARFTTTARTFSASSPTPSP